MSDEMVRRFPRMAGVTPRVLLTERLLRHTYNKLRKSRSMNQRILGRYDIYKTKFGVRAPFWFLLLAQILVQKKVDPSLYIKVMSQYGKYAETRYLPHPQWLASAKAMEVFDWLYKRQRAKWDKHSDWKRALRGHKEKDIFRAIQASAEMLIQARETFHMGELEVVLMLKDELNPWFLATYLPNTTKKFQSTLMGVVRSQKELHQKVVLCLRYFNLNMATWRRARKVFQGNMG